MSFKIIDCHNHVYAEEFDNDRNLVLEDAKNCGVVGMITVSEFVEDAEKLLDLAEKYPNFCFPSLGVHPVQKAGKAERSATIEDLNQMKPYIDEHADKLVCIGEVGLDFTPRICHSETDKESQRLVFSEQMKIADKLNLPVNVHSRSAGRPVVKLLKESNVKSALLHAFDGKVSVAMEGVQLGYYFSIPPCVVRSEQKDKIVKALPLDRILLETDCPALGPDKMARNDPANIKISFEYIAKAKNVDTESLSKIIFENTLKLFPKLSVTSS